jgi:ABC-type sulfate transport system permease subunit
MSSVGQYLEGINYGPLYGILFKCLRKDLGQYGCKKYVVQHFGIQKCALPLDVSMLWFIE